EPREEMTPAERGMLYALYCLFGATPVWVIAFSVALSSQLLVWLPLPYELVSHLWAVGLVGWVGLFYGLAYRVWRRRALKPLRELSLRIECNPREPGNYFERGELYLAFTSEDQRAAADFTAVIELEPQNWLAFVRRARAKMRAQDHEAA